MFIRLRALREIIFRFLPLLVLPMRDRILFGILYLTGKSKRDRIRNDIKRNDWSD